MSEWVTQVFDFGVGFDLNKIEGRDKAYPEPLQSLLGKCIESCRAFKGPCVLPIVSGDKQVELMVAARTPEESAELYGIAQAYLGSVYARVGRQIISKPSCEAQSLLLSRFPGGIVQIRIPRSASNSQDYQARVYKAIEVVLEFVEQYNNRPPMLSNVRRLTGRVLRDFFVALRDRDPRSGWRYFDELRRAGSLSARNLLFLEIQGQAAFENWEAIVDHPALEDVLSGRVPRAVAVAFLLAADTLFLHQEALHALNPDEARERLVPAASFFRSRPDLGEDDESIRAWRGWCIGAALLGNLHGAQSVKERVGTSWFQQLAEIMELRVPEDTQASRAEKPLESLIDSPASLGVAIELLKFTLEGDDEQCRLIAEALEGYPAEIIDELRLKPAIRFLLDALGDVGPTPGSVRGWAEWFNEAQSRPDSESLVNSVIEGAAYWDKAGWNEGALKRLADNGGSAVQEVLRDILPVLLDWLDRHDMALGVGSAESLLVNLALDDVSSVQDLSLARDLLERVLAQAHTGTIYASMLEAVQAIWEKIKSVHALTGLCDMFDLLLEAPCANEAARQSLWQDLQGVLLANWSRLDEETKALGRALSQELLGSSDQFEIGQGETGHEAGVEKVDLSGKKVAICSLMEGAAQRAKRALEQIYPGINVVLNHDHTASAALVHLAQSADFFIFSSQAAKHQSFYAVTSIRNDIIYPDGRGTMSMLRKFAEAVE